MSKPKVRNYNKIIWLLSILIPIAVAVLFRVKIDMDLPVFLPPIYAGINALTFVILLSAFWAVRTKKLKLHEKLMKTCVLLSALFLLMYVLHHMTSDSTPYGGQGSLRYVYFVVLISHILLSVIVIPFVLITFARGLNQEVEKHKKIARITFPLWLYVTLSGVIVYLMISPYYS